MKICIVSQEYPPETGHGGIGAYACTISRALARLGHGVFVVSSTSDAKEKHYEADGVNVLRLPLSAPKVITHRKAVDLISYSKKVSAAVRALNDSVGLDVVEFPDLAAEGHALIRNGKTPLPAVTRIHTPLYLVFKHDKRAWTAQTRAMSELENEVIHNSPFLTAPSRFVAERVSEDLGIERAKIRVVPNAVDCARFAASEESDDCTILCVGRLQYLKGTHVLVKAVPQILERFPKARFVFAGRDTLSGPGGTSYKDWMLGTISKSHWRGLEFLDEVEADAVPALYRKVAVAVVPSLYENFPNVCLEAMAAGRPLVASKVGGIPEMVDDGRSGLLVKPSNPIALADALCGLLEDGRLRAELGRAARKSVLAKFDSTVVAEKMIETYEEAIAAFEKQYAPLFDM
jgi:glycosyltransferase involved in cell wall biosynthesis